jgi:hypothetical protein
MGSIFAVPKNAIADTLGKYSANCDKTIRRVTIAAQNVIEFDAFARNTSTSKTQLARVSSVISGMMSPRSIIVL